MNRNIKIIIAAFLLLCVDLAANGVNSLWFSWLYTIKPTVIWDFPITMPEVVISLSVGYLWNIVIVFWFLFFISSSMASGFSRNKSAFIFGLLLIGFCIGDWVSNFWAILKIPSAVTVYWIILTFFMNFAKSFILSYYYGGSTTRLQ
jgi:membrane protein insertase Oxa1/YidC/SpoIIIJ